MLKTLIKKQLLELNRSFFIDRKTGKGKSARSATFSIVLFILLMIFAIGGIVLLYVIFDAPADNLRHELALFCYYGRYRRAFRSVLRRACSTHIRASMTQRTTTFCSRCPFPWRDIMGGAPHRSLSHGADVFGRCGNTRRRRVFHNCAPRNIRHNRRYNGRYGDCSRSYTVVHTRLGRCKNRGQIKKTRAL